MSALALRAPLSFQHVTSDWTGSMDAMAGSNGGNARELKARRYPGAIAGSIEISSIGDPS